jgi:regulator of replication initiation timing
MYLYGMSKFIALLFLAFSFTSVSQERATLKRLKHDKEVCKAFAEKSIQEISDGVLLVRLNFQQKRIDYLTARKDTASANQVSKKAMNVNKKIAAAFSEKFDFCKVYFFKMSDSKFIRNQQFDSITLFDLSFKEVDNSVIQSDNYLIGEFSRIKQDTVQYYSDERIDTSVEKSKTKTYYGGSKNGREAFIIMDRKFQQIQKPFPYFAGLQAVLSEGVRFKKALEVINSKLHNYSSQVGTKEE